MERVWRHGDGDALTFNTATSLVRPGMSFGLSKPAFLQKKFWRYVELDTLEGWQSVAMSA